MKPSANQIKKQTLAKRTDLETRLKEDDHHSIKLWLRLLTCSGLIEKYIREKLRDEFGTTLPRFDFMAQLQRNPQGLMMGELSELMMVSGGNISGIATQLVRERLISRTALPTDGRAVLVRLTPAGSKAFAKMAERHEEWIIQVVGKLQKKEIVQMTRKLGHLKESILEVCNTRESVGHNRS